MLKKTLLAIAIAAAALGCAYAPKQQYYKPAGREAQAEVHDFNDEVYVWEDFFLPTNGTTRAVY